MFCICIYLLMGCEWAKHVINYYSFRSENMSWNEILFCVLFWPIDFSVHFFKKYWL
jgi:hypothetical protein